MKIEEFIHHLQKLQELCPGAEIYFTDGNGQECFETYLQTFNIDDENNNIEILLNMEGI